MNKNMKLFNELSAKVFDSLIEVFPVEKEYRIEDFPEFDNAENSEVFNSTFHFLENENYIKYQKQIPRCFVGVVLTSKGLSVLNASPPVLKNNETVSQSIKKALKSGSEEVISDTMKKLFAFGTKYIIENLA